MEHPFVRATGGILLAIITAVNRADGEAVCGVGAQGLRYPLQGVTGRIIFPGLAGGSEMKFGGSKMEILEPVMR